MGDWITETFTALGYWGIALATFLENVVPPIPSEAILPAAGLTARRGGLTLWGVIVAGTAGALAGAILWYWIGRWVGTERLIAWADRRGKYFGFSANDIRRADDWFERWGGTAVFVGRMIPGIRTLISVPAGISGMPFGRFVLYSFAGTAVWSTALVLVGWWLGEQSAAVERFLSWAGIAVVVGLVAWIARRIWKARRHRDGLTPDGAEAASGHATAPVNEHAARSPMKTLDLLSARRLVEQEPNLAVVEALPEEYFDDWHLPGAVNIPVDERFEETAARLVPDKSRPVMVYAMDGHGRESQKAALRLERLGYREVYEFPGGKIEWKENGLPTEP